MAMHGFQVRHIQQRNCCDPKGVEGFFHTPITRIMFNRGIGIRYGSFPIFTVTAQKRTDSGKYRGGKDVGRGKNEQSGPPPWKRYQKKTIGKQVEATLELIWERTQWPSDETIDSLWDLHRVRRDVVIDWFSKRRKRFRSGHSATNWEKKDNTDTSYRESKDSSTEDDDGLNN